MIRKLLLRIWRVSPTTLLRTAAVLTLIGLGFMVWSMVDPTPWPVLLAMSVGQGIGTIAFTLYGLAVYKDLRRIRRARRESQQLLIMGDSSQQLPVVRDSNPKLARPKPTAEEPTAAEEPRAQERAP